MRSREGGFFGRLFGEGKETKKDVTEDPNKQKVEAENKAPKLLEEVRGFISEKLSMEVDRGIGKSEIFDPEDKQPMVAREVVVSKASGTVDPDSLKEAQDLGMSIAREFTNNVQNNQHTEMTFACGDGKKIDIRSSDKDLIEHEEFERIDGLPSNRKTKREVLEKEKIIRRETTKREQIDDTFFTTTKTNEYKGLEIGTWHKYRYINKEKGRSDMVEGKITMQFDVDGRKVTVFGVDTHDFNPKYSIVDGADGDNQVPISKFEYRRIFEKVKDIVLEKGGQIL